MITDGDIIKNNETNNKNDFISVQEQLMWSPEVCLI